MKKRYRLLNITGKGIKEVFISRKEIEDLNKELQQRNEITGFVYGLMKE